MTLSKTPWIKSAKKSCSGPSTIGVPEMVFPSTVYPRIDLPCSSTEIGLRLSGKTRSRSWASLPRSDSGAPNFRVPGP